MLKGTSSTRSGTNKFVRSNVITVNRGENSLRTFGPILWNTMLPENLKCLDSLDTFIENIKKWVPDNCNCKICKTYVEGLGFIEIFD